jgi:hypothetical protein
VTFDELFSKALGHAASAEYLLSPEAIQDATAPAPEILRERAAIEATLAEAYARLVSAAIVNRTSLHALLEQDQAQGGPKPS